MRTRRSILLVGVLLAGCRESPGPATEPTPSASAATTNTPTLASATSGEAGEGGAAKAPDPGDLARAATRSPIDDDEAVTAYPAIGWWEDGGWKLDLQLWFYEPEESSLRRGALLAAVREAVGGSDGAEAELLVRRTRPFLYDNEGGETLAVRLGSMVVKLPETSGDGRTRAIIDVPATVVSSAGGSIEYQVITRPDDSRRFTGTAHFVPPAGVLLVSDIDDTVKITDVRDHGALVRGTLLEPFAFVGGTSEAYRRALGSGGHLHFLSGSPWQLYQPLAEGLSEAGFPDATFTLKAWRPGRIDLGSLLADPFEAKLAALEELAARFPKRRFLLVGDSGEKDPEVYGAFVRAHPKLVAHVAIRDVTRQKRDDPRYTEAFRDVEPKVWEIYDDPSSLFGDATAITP